MRVNDFLPSLTVVIPTYNANKYIDACLRRIFNQKYPLSLLRVLIVDGGSTDGTLKTVRSYDVEILHNKLKEAEIGKIIGFKKARSDLFMYLDADIELACDDWFKRIVFPLQDDPTIVASFTRFLARRSDPALNRYLAYHELMLDPVMRFFCPSIGSTVIESRGKYHVCSFEPGKVPPAGVQVYRMCALKRVVQEDEARWWDIDIPVRLAKHGYNKFAYVENAGLYHSTVEKFSDLLSKKRWMITKSFLPNLQNREYRYLDFSSKGSILRLLGWVSYANLLFLAFIKGVEQSIREKDRACMYHPLVTAALTDYYVYCFFRQKEGRNLLRQTFCAMLRAD